MSGLQSWMLSELAALLGVAESEVSATRPLMEQGVDSVSLVRLSGMLSERLGVELDPMLLYDHPTVEKLAAWLERVHPVETAPFNRSGVTR